MSSIPGFWDVGPHNPILVEPTWQEFVRQSGGVLVADLLTEPCQFANADFVFLGSGIVAELKVVETEFSTSRGFLGGLDKLISRVMIEDPSWRPLLFGGSGKYPKWFYREFVRLFRPPISRILKKANRQLRDTKRHFAIQSGTGVLLFVNDGFASLEPEWIRALAWELLQHSYSSIDCFLYLTVNRYVEIAGSDTPRLLWVPTYSERAPDFLVEFIDDLGRKWFDFLEQRVGPFTTRTEGPFADQLRGARSIVLPK
jgi:hypothetical protein